jgi:uncharacterized protein YqfA (UPF0365 family)
MNTVAQFLIEEATNIRESSPELVAVDLLKQAGVSEMDAKIAVAQDTMEKRAFTELTYKGIDADEALRLIKVANINITELPGVDVESEEDRLASILEKAAAYIEKQAAYIEELEKSAGRVEYVDRVVEVQAPAEPEMPEAFTKMASSGAFTFEDLEALKAMPPETLTKVASAFDEPWELGKGTGYARPKTDPLLEFLLG